MLPCTGGGPVQHDGLGMRRAAHDARWGHVEILDVSQEISTPIAELAIRAAAARLPRSGSVLSPVHAIERTGSSLRVISGVVDGRRLSDLLEALEAQTLRLPDEALLELAAMVVTAVRWLHETPGASCHGAVSPSHMVLKENGQLMLTDGVFGEVLSRLRVSQDHLWREYGLALPSVAGDPALRPQWGHRRHRGGGARAHDAAPASRRRVPARGGRPREGRHCPLTRMGTRAVSLASAIPAAEFRLRDVSRVQCVVRRRPADSHPPSRWRTSAAVGTVLAGSGRLITYPRSCAGSRDLIRTAAHR